jgi:hypothetical protein
MSRVRTTLTIDDDLAAALKDRAHDERRSFKEVVNEVLRRGLAERPVGHEEEPKPWPFPTYDMGRALVDLTKANQLAGELEDAEIVRRMHRS